MKQTWPKMWLKIGPFAIITNWHDRMPMAYTRWKTSVKRETYFSTTMLCFHKFGPFFWVKEYQSEVLKEETDATHPRWKGKTIEEFYEWKRQQ